MHVPPPTPAVPPGTPAPLPGAEAALVGVAALIVVTVPFLWPLAGHFSTMAHEGAHALAAFLLGFTLDGVLLDLNTDGATGYWYNSASSTAAARRIVTGFVGYLGPSAFGLWAAKLIETGRVATVLWLAILLLVLLLFLVRRSFGMISVPAAIALVAVVVHDARAGLEVFISYGMTWLLLLSGVRVAVTHGANASDAFTLNRTTGVPRRIWALLWLAGTVLAVVIGGKWLVLRT